MMSFAPKRHMGWLPDYPDFRDYTEETEAIQDILRPESAAKSGGTAPAATATSTAAAATRKRAATAVGKSAVATKAAAKAALPPAVDLRPWCSPVEDQGALGSCTAHAGVGIIEYYERKAFGRHTDASRLFLYKVTRNHPYPSAKEKNEGGHALKKAQQGADDRRPSDPELLGRRLGRRRLRLAPLRLRPERPGRGLLDHPEERVDRHGLLRGMTQANTPKTVTLPKPSK